MTNLNDYLNGLESIIIIITSIVALISINDWRKEHKWKNKFELAEKTLLTTYSIKQVFNWATENLSELIVDSQNEKQTEIQFNSKIGSLEFLFKYSMENNELKFENLQLLTYRVKMNFPEFEYELIFKLFQEFTKLQHGLTALLTKYKLYTYSEMKKRIETETLEILKQFTTEFEGGSILGGKIYELVGVIEKTFGKYSK